MDFFLVMASEGYFLAVALGLLVVVASLVAERGLQVYRLSRFGFWALEYRLSSCDAWT